MDNRRLLKIRVLTRQDGVLESEKRQHKRVVCEIESFYQNLDTVPVKAICETCVNDLSQGGIRFRTPNFIPVQNKLLFQIIIPNQKAIEAVAQPAWIREIPPVSQYEVGAKFLSISETDRKLIRRYTQNF